MKSYYKSKRVEHKSIYVIYKIEISTICRNNSGAQMYTDYKEFGKRIAKRRRQLGLSQTKVNEMAGLSDKYLSNIERAVSIPSIDVLMKICAVLKTTPDELLLGTEKSGNIGNVGRIAAMKTEALPREKQLLALSLLDWLNEQKI